jgi:hypothetical protein
MISTENGTSKQPVPPLSEWASLFVLCDISLEQELADWNCTLSDGLED